MVDSRKYGSPIVATSKSRMRSTGSSLPCGFHELEAMIGRQASDTARSATCRYACRRGPSRVVQSAYAYPASSTLWKKTRQVVHTPAEPPNHGRICLAMIGCTRNSRNDERKIVAAYGATTTNGVRIT